jgi:phosphohistidine phosphatase
MKIYILRHAIAVQRGTPGYPNDDRPLTEEGIEKMKINASGIAKLIDETDEIFSSPLLRALDTAKITANALNHKKEIIITEHLIAGSRLTGLYNFLSKYNNSGSIMLVGHEPHLGYLASNLVGITESVIEFRKGGICLIEIDKLPPVLSGILKWNLTPKQLRLIAK